MSIPIWLKAVPHLFLNHMDAWVAALLAGVVALALHGRVQAHTLLLAVGLAVGYWLAFALNDYYDAPADALEPEKGERNFFVQVAVSKWQLTTAVLLIGLPLAVLFLSFGWRSLPVMGISLVIMWGYSAPPLHFKNRPGLDLLIHALFVQTFPYLVVLFLTQSSWLPVDGVALSVTFLGSLTAQLEQQLRDYEVDAAAGVRNFATRFGVGLTRRLLYGATAVLGVISVVSVVAGWVPWTLVPIALIALPAMLHRYLRPAHAPRSERLVKLLTAVGFVYALFLIRYYWPT